MTATESRTAGPAPGRRTNGPWWTHPAAAVGLLLAAAVVGNGSFFLAADYVPLHDTGHAYQVFATAYWNLVFAGELPEWLPHGVYGFPTHLQDLFALSPLSYPVMALGKIIGAGDALWLFRLVIVLELAVFAWGFYLLAEGLLGDRRLALAALVPLLMTVTVFHNLYFGFRLVYLLPLVMHLLLGFLKTGRLTLLALSAMLVLAAMFGNVLYFPFFYVLLGGGLLAFAYLPLKDGFRLRVDGAAVPAGLAVLVLAGLGAYQLLGAVSELAFTYPYRDPETLSVSLKAFLKYGHGGVAKTLELFAALPLHTVDSTFYVPAAALLFAAYALIRAGDSMVYVFVALFAIFVLLTWGRFSPLAYAVYYIPGGTYVRHLGLVHAIPKVLLCLIAGFGLRHYLSLGDSGDGGARRLLGLIAAVSAVPATATFAAQALDQGGLDAGSVESNLVALAALGFIVLAAAAFSPLRRRALLGVFLATAVLQGGLYTAGVTAMVSRGHAVDAAVRERVTRARPYTFEETRRTIPDHPAFAQWRAFKPGLFFFTTHMVHYAVLGMDPCVPAASRGFVAPRASRNILDYHSPYVGDLVARLFWPGATVEDLDRYYRVQPGNPFFRLVGCHGRAKLRRIARFTETVPPAGVAVPADVLARAVLVEDPATGARRLIRPQAGADAATRTLHAQGMTVTHFSANRLEVRLDGAGAGDSWLVYADSFHPAWRAVVDGRRTKVWKANLAFKAVRLPAGAKRVGFDVSQPRRQWAQWLSALMGVLAMVLGGLAGGARQRP